ncbi:MAG: HD domain-containing phosphohydrolase [Bacillota bacterium]
MEIINDIIINIVLLFGLVFIISLSNKNITFKGRSARAFTGLLIGLVTIVIMINAWEMRDGVFFDTRTVMISVTALFFSPLTSVIATAVPTAYRIFIGGVGMYAGILSMVSALIIGLIWKYKIHAKLLMNIYFEYYIFGVVVHIFMLLSQLVLPYPENLDVLRNISIIVMISYPLAVMLLSMAIMNHEQRLDNSNLLKKSEKKYRSLIDNSKLGIIQYNTSGIIEVANQAFADILESTLDKLIGLDMRKLNNHALIDKLNMALAGKKSIFEGNYTSLLTGKTFPTRVQFSPITEDDIIIGGIGIIEDMTKDYENKKRMQELIQEDALTKLLNRNAFDTFLLDKKRAKRYPITIAVFDINTFQIINTSFGYDTGNQVLLTIARIFKKHILSSDAMHVYRTGGDEFALIIEGKEHKDAVSMIKFISKKLNSIDRFSFDLNISYGYSTTYDSHTALSDTFNEALTNLNTSKIYDGSSISKKTIDVIMTTLFEKSKREKIHSERVSKIAKGLAKTYHLGTAFTNRVSLAARLHDIGKINIAEDILDKPGKLTEKEREKINKHPESGFKILSSVTEYMDIANIVLTHHEKYDGSGYPKGLKGHDIPLEARIIAVADAYDAMTEQRTYRDPMTKAAAIKELKDYSNIQFDGDVVNKFIEYIN